MTICEQVGRWAAGLAEEVIPERVRDRAQLQRRSIWAAAHAGSGVAAPFAAVAPEGALGDVFASAAASMAHDWDDYLYMGHAGHSAVPAAHSFSDDPSRALVAQVAANEVAGRLGLALFVGPHNGQFWASIHCASAAVAAGVALELEADRLAHALAIALYQPPYGLWPGFMGPSTKLLTAAEPAVQGARAALLAAEGVDGPLDVIEDERGLLTHLAFVRRPGAFGGLGDVWLTDTLAFKPRPGCAYLQAAVDAALLADVAAADVREVEIAAGYLTVAMEALGARAGLRPVGVTFSTRLSVAVALLAGRLTHDELDPAWLSGHESAIHELVGRTRVRHDWELTLATVEGAAAGGASLRDVRVGAWPGVLRRLRELHMADLSLGSGELRALVSEPRLIGRLRRATMGQGSGGTAALDTAALRMTFPCRVTLRLRSGRTIELPGQELGGCGHSLSEQCDVVTRKCETVGLPTAMPAAPRFTDTRDARHGSGAS
jgi:2-methylcitrate dehydratase MmgE/PrpD-like protein